jgi:DNA gyrase subunit A
MRFVPAPDFPTGARIIDTDGIREAYRTGRGAVTCEAVASTEVRSGNLPRIVVTEIPYQVNKATLLERIADLVDKKQLDAIRDLRDESSRDGMRIVIELKRGEDPAAVLAKLYAKTDLRTNFNINTVALVDGGPQTLGLRDCLVHYVAHQRDVLTRRTEHRLAQATARAHILEGLLKALDHLDEVIALIRRSASASVAKQGLMDRFDLSELQAQAVLDMRLRRLAALERAELEDEYQELQDLINELRAILADRGRLDEVLVAEISEIKRVHATPRRSRIVGEGITAEDVLAGGAQAGFEAQEVTVLVTRGGYAKPVPTRRTTPGHKHGHDPLAAVVRCTTEDDLLLVDEGGTGHRLSVADVPVVRPSDRGTHVGGVVGGGPDVPVAGAVALIDGTSVVTVSASGQVKRTDAGEFLASRQRSIQAAGVKGGDRLVAVLLCRDGEHLMLANSAGFVTRFPVDDVRAMGRTAAGVSGMNLPKGAKIVSATTVAADDVGEVMTVGADGTVKRTALSEYATKGRGGKGLQTGVDRLLYCGAAGDLHVHSDKPFVVRPVDAPLARRTGKGQQLEGDVSAPVLPEDDIARWRA